MRIHGCGAAIAAARSESRAVKGVFVARKSAVVTAMTGGRGRVATGRCGVAGQFAVRRASMRRVDVTPDAGVRMVLDLCGAGHSRDHGRMAGVDRGAIGHVCGAMDAGTGPA